MSETVEKPFALARRATGNALFSLGAFGYSVVLSIVITPLMIHGLGATYYGIFAISTVALGFVGMLDLGMGTALVRFLSTTLGRGDDQESQLLIRASVAFYGVIGLIGTAVISIVALLFTADLFHSLTSKQVAVARFALLVAGAAFTFDTVARAFSAVPLALQRNGVGGAVQVTLATIGAATTAAVIWMGYGLRTLTAAYAVIDIVSMIVAVVVARLVLPGLRASPSWDLGRIRQLLTFSGWVFVARISAFLIFQFDRLMLGSLSSVSNVTYYAVPSSIASYLLAATTTLAGVVLPAVSDLLAREEVERARRLYRRATRLCTLFVGSLAIPGVFFAHDLLSLWLGSAFAHRSGTVLQILVITFVFFCVTVVPYNVLLAGGSPRILGFLNLAIAVLNVILVFALVPGHGARGAAVAYLGSMVVTPAFVWFAERKALGYEQTQWVGIVLPVLPGLAVQAVLCAVVARGIGATPWLVPVILCLLVVPGIVYFFTGLSEPDERDMLRSFLRRSTLISRAS